MRAERQLLRLGDYLVGRACQRLPPGIRAERYREWAAELPVILHDPRVRFASRRAARMLGYAADTLRAAALTDVKPWRRRPAITTALRSLLLADLAIVGWDTWSIAQAPGQPLNYLRLAWGLLLVAYPITMLAGSAVHTGTPLVIGSNLLGAAVNLWDAAQTPRDSADWVNYCVAALLLVLLLALWLASRRARARRT
jgi:hypothetical protein